MKRVETIHINGIVFSISDDAFIKLNSYLNTLSRKFEKEQEREEIITDIEARISELFAERDGGRSRVVTLEDVILVIETLGTPEDIADIEATATPPRSSQTNKKTRRLYRDPDRRLLSGVCAGIAAWLGIKPFVVRLVFVGLTVAWGISLAIYFILWIIIPIAKTTAQKLEMRGEPVNISNIEKNIRENFSESSINQSFHNFLDEAGAILGKTSNVIGRILAILIGLFLCGISISFTILAIGVFFMQDLIFYESIEWDFLSFTESLRYLTSPTSHAILVICAVIIISLLILAFLFWGLRLIVGFKVRNKWLHFGLFFIWTAAIITGFVVSLAESRNYLWQNDQIVETIPIASTRTLFLSANTPLLKLSNNPLDIYFDKDNQQFYGKPYLQIHKSQDEQISLRFSRNSQGKSKLDAYKYAEDIKYNVEIIDSLLVFDLYFKVIPQNKWKFQRLQVTLYVPVGTVIIADRIISNARFHGNWTHLRNFEKNSWIMTENNGLQQWNRQNRITQ